ncbi:LOW QUALITY PROTEIN: hypothetical protein OSB04_023594 [Centaurea solstitialis]|uniref:Uncharacterized protein n=1 Tax=Centaurea solstitialis TaxID=347529 RepID=A0AA38W2F1_9ASTR|nr:LOW QUALITY PROTEIN: hypothetical protein OSB04_023594 [Centaurea solstitialis]
MAAIVAFSNQKKTIHNSHKFSFSLKPTNYGYWRSMIEAFLTSHNLFGYVDGIVPCPQQKVTNESATTDNPSLHPVDLKRCPHEILLCLDNLFILHRAGLADCKPIATPMSTSHLLLPDDSPLLDDPSRYRQTVGPLPYATLSRPDIAFAVNKVCQFMHAPTENHWAGVKRILRYLKETIDLGLWIRHNTGYQLQAFSDSHWSSNLQAYSDSDWAGCPIDRRGYAIYLGSNLISWSARKQKTVSRSSTESEYKAIADTIAELIWLKSLLQELGLNSKAPTLWCDNLGATYLSANPVFHARTKHVEVDYHFVREQVTQGKLNVKFISTGDQIADIFTKPLPSRKFEFLRSKLQIANRAELAGEY